MNQGQDQTDQRRSELPERAVAPPSELAVGNIERLLANVCDRWASTAPGERPETKLLHQDRRAPDNRPAQRAERSRDHDVEEIVQRLAVHIRVRAAEGVERIAV